MKKQILTICSSLFILLSHNTGYAMVIDALNVSWSTTNGASFYLYGLTMAGSHAGCMFTFQNTTNPASFNNIAFGGSYIEPNAIGHFTYYATAPMNCNAIGDTFTLLAQCLAEWNSIPETNGQNFVKITGICTE